MVDDSELRSRAAAARLRRLMTHDQEALPAAAIKILFDERLASQEAHFIALERRIGETRDAILGLIGANEKSIAAAMVAADRAIMKAEAANEKRFEGVNEFRQAMSDQNATFVTRTEHAAELRAIAEKFTAFTKMINDNTDRITAQEGRGVGYQQSWGIFISLAGLALIVLFEFLRRP